MSISRKRALLVFSYAEFWDMVSFFGTLSILILYLTRLLHFNDEQSYSIYSIYVMLFCAFPILGGMINDHFIGDKLSLYLGGALIFFGNMLLFIQNLYFLFIGISLTITGTALFKTTCTNMVGKIYHDFESEKGWAYSNFYAVLNMGAIVGPVLYGLVSKLLFWNYSFLIGSTGVLSSLALFRFSSIGKFRNEKKITTCKKIMGCLIVALCSIITSMLFIFHTLFCYFSAIFMSLLLLFLAMYLRKCIAIDRKRILGILALLAFTVFFFLSSLQVGSSINLFISKFVSVSVFNIKVPGSCFIALDPLFLVLSAPLIAKIWVILDKNKIEINPFLTVSIGLLFSALSFIFFWIASINVSSHHIYIIMISLLLGFLMIGAGEMIFSPVVLSTISKKSPSEIKNTMMGCWYLFMAIAGYSGSIIDRGMSGISEQLKIFPSIFLITSLISLLSSFFLFLTSSFFKKLLN